MDNELKCDHNNLETGSTTRPLYPIAGESNTHREFCCKHRSEHLIEDAPSSRPKSEHAYGLQSQADSTSRCNGILASGKLFRLVTKAAGLWNPRVKRYALLCAFFCSFEYFIIAGRNNNSKQLWSLCRSLRYNFQERDKCD